MTDREKVVKGLELCGYMEGMPQCDSCPYDGKQCWKRLKNDAIALLKAQEPRVMTLEYFDNSPEKDSKGCLVAWVEYRRDEEWVEYWEDTCDEWSVVRRDDFYSGESYRFWTARPDEKRRAETPWN